MKNLTWSEFKDLAFELVNQIHKKNKYQYIYGIPRGGIPVALELASHLGLTIIDSNELQTCDPSKVIVCDDIIDSGTTRNRYYKYDFASLFVRDHYIMGHGSARREQTPYARVSTEWVHFPWETDTETSGEDLVRRMIQFIGDNPKDYDLNKTFEIIKGCIRGYNV